MNLYVPGFQTSHILTSAADPPEKKDWNSKCQIWQEISRTPPY